MAEICPRPDGWEGGSDDFEFLNTFNGRKGINLFTPSDLASDIEWRRNAKLRSGNHYGLDD
jgi:hypothetical protein